MGMVDGRGTLPIEEGLLTSFLWVFLRAKGRRIH